MTAATSSSFTQADSSVNLKTFSEKIDPNNGSYLAPVVHVDDALRSKATFAVGASLFTLPATPSDVVEIAGSATKTVRIKKIAVEGVATTAKQWPLAIIRRAAAIADGTATTPVPVRYDSGDAAPSATIRHFTVLGTPAAGNPASNAGLTADLLLVTPTSIPQPVVFDFCRSGEKGLTLRGAADTVVVNLGGGALTAGEKLSYSVIWEEDAS
jgi:hypothetical protein